MDDCMLKVLGSVVTKKDWFLKKTKKDWLLVKRNMSDYIFLPDFVLFIMMPINNFSVMLG